MKMYYMWEFKLHNCHAGIGHFMLLLVLMFVMTGCGSKTDGNNTHEKNSNQVSIPVSIRALVLPVDTTSFTAHLYLDDGTTPKVSAAITTDGKQKTVDFNDVIVAVGEHTFKIKFVLKTPNYELVLASAVSNKIIVNKDSSQLLQFDGNYQYHIYDLDGDRVSNLDEIKAGTPPDDDVCVLGVSLVGYCRVGA